MPGIRSIAVAIWTGVALLAASRAGAESADHYRGGWRIEAGPPQIYEFVIRDGGAVSGIACTHCADGTTLARVEGRFNETDGLTFTVRRFTPAGALASEEHLRAKLSGGRLVISGGRGSDGKPVERIAIKDTRGPPPSIFPTAILPPGAPPVPVLKSTAVAGGGGGGRPAPYLQPGPWRSLTAADVVGVWIGFGFGRDKQYFLIRQDGEKLFGLACGPCDNPYTMGSLENFAIRGDTLAFDIEHQDWGEGAVLPFVRHVTAHIAMNELRMDARRADVAGGAPIVASLIGPISIQSTAGNKAGD
ncbi:MAG: hypothetical protein J7485_11550 [Sphingobium sp.]|nr:hypothetical protein [Sphingobium sp.]